MSILVNMKKARYNKHMKTRKKLTLVAAAVLVVGGAGAGAVLALQPEKITPKTASAPVNSQVENTVKETASVDESPAPAVVESPAPAVVEEQQPVETVDSVLDGAAWNGGDRECIDMMRSLKPAWFADVETAKKFVSAMEQYVAPCWGLEIGSNGQAVKRQFQVQVDKAMGLTQ